MGGTRVIYQEGKREAAISVTNADTHTPYLVQSWVENYAENDKARVPFIVTPPLFRLDPEQNNVLRINFIGASLPRDRESVFWLNVKSIAPTPQGEVNKLQVNIKSKFKIFYRPNDLAGDPAKAWQQLKFSQSGGRLTVINPTPYFVSFLRRRSGRAKHRRSRHGGSFGEKTWPVSGHGTVKWRAINDYGGVSDFAQQ
ncbi:molecular chaperone [Klebsiella pneumoniae subsp. pneumoniae]|nr:molecular chaperone [Klebsiella pneumoniae subsp. pneumoniae]